MTDIEKFYNEKIKKEESPDFSDLSADTIQFMTDSLKYSAWKLKKISIELNKSVDKWMNNYNKKS